MHLLDRHIDLSPALGCSLAANKRGVFLFNAEYAVVEYHTKERSDGRTLGIYKRQESSKKVRFLLRTGGLVIPTSLDSV